MKRIYLLLSALVAGTSLQAQTTITVDASTEYQTIVGLGGAEGANNASEIKFLNDFMGASLIRHHIETSNSDKVTIANIADGTVPFEVLTADRIAYFQAMKTRGVTVIASCWSPPACLKLNNCISQRAQAVVGGPWICGQPCAAPACPSGYSSADPDNILLPANYDDYARYLALWAKNFQTKTGVNLYAVSIQNEPLFNEPYPSAKLLPAEYGPAMKAAHDTFAAYPELSGIKFFGPENMANNMVTHAYVTQFVDNATYGPLLDAYAVHGYSDGIAPDLGSSSIWDAYAKKMIDEKGKMTWMSETSGEGTDWTSSFEYAKGMFLMFKSGRISLYAYYGMGGSAGMYYGSPNRRLYHHMHFYRFIRPGMKMIKVSDTDASVEAIAFKNGSDVTVIAFNLSKTESKTIQFSDFAGKPSFYHVYLSDPTTMCAYAGKVTDNTFVLRKESYVTITYNSTDPEFTYGPKPVQNLTATKITDNTITVTWDKASSWTLAGNPVTITGYVVYINGIKKTMTPTTNNTYNFTGLVKNTAYKIEILTRDAMYNESVATVLNVVTTCSTSDCGPPPVIDALIEKTEGFAVSPNPASEQIIMTLPDEQPYTIQFVNIAGQVVLTSNNITNGAGINVSSLSAGMYVVIAKGENKIFKTKIVKE